MREEGQGRKGEWREAVGGTKWVRKGEVEERGESKGRREGEGGRKGLHREKIE